MVFLSLYNQIQFITPCSKRVPFSKTWNTNALKWYSRMSLGKKMGFDRSFGGQNNQKKKLLKMPSFTTKKKEIIIQKLKKLLKRLKKSKK